MEVIAAQTLAKAKIQTKENSNNFFSNQSICINKPFINYKLTFKMYLNQIFHSLCEKKKEKNSHLSLRNFLQFLDLPYDFSKEIFFAIIEDDRNYMTKNEFINAIMELFGKYFPEDNNKTIILLFRIFSKNEECINLRFMIKYLNKLLLNVLLFNKIYDFNLFSMIMEEIEKLVNFSFSKYLVNKNFLNFDDFKNVLIKDPEFYYVCLFFFNMISPSKNKIFEILLDFPSFKDIAQLQEEDLINEEKTHINKINCTYEKTNLNYLNKYNNKKFQSHNTHLNGENVKDNYNDHESNDINIQYEFAL